MNIIGVMSGTSLDGLDLALCTFRRLRGQWTFRVLRAETIAYDSAWRNRLASAHELNGLELMRLHRDFGLFTGHCCKAFAGRDPVDLIASHGHTVFHRPDEQLTLQIGDGAAIAAESGIRTVADFRRQDVALGGQGAPLVPIGDELLFGAYTACLNLGGFANISYRQGDRRIAFDVGPFNLVFNHYAAKAGYAFDRDGKLSRAGRCCPALLHELNALPYYAQQAPKSLGREWVDSVVFPLIDGYGLAPGDVLNTWSRHISAQLTAALPTAGHLTQSSQAPDGSADVRTLLVTGGGAFHAYALELLSRTASCRIVIPDHNLVNYKEAVIFAFLGLLRVRGLANTLASVTGAVCDHAGGTIYEAF